ncbi:MAG: hypothetical protein AB7F98_09130 [Novosphingobium sp.]
MESSEGAHCGKCAGVVRHVKGAPRVPCPNCGATVRILEVAILETVEARDSIAMKVKRAGTTGKPAFESKNVWEQNFDRDEVVNVQRTIDRETDRYTEIISTPGGSVIKHVDEPLSRHRGRGDDKPKGNP